MCKYLAIRTKGPRNGPNPKRCPFCGKLPAWCKCGY